MSRQADAIGPGASIGERCPAFGIISTVACGRTVAKTARNASGWCSRAGVG